MSTSLAVYFSASGRTKKAAEYLAKATGSDLFEIVPETLYTPADLDWRDKGSRSTIEMNDPAARPAIASKIEDISKYDTIYLGFPIWWYREPSIIDTFLESYDFTGKTIVPFATSGSSGMGDSSKNMQELVPDATVKEGKRFPERVSEEEIKNWVKTL